MSTPTGDNGFLHELELMVRTELTVEETSRPEDEPHCVLYVEGLPDPDAQRYEVALQNLLGAVETLEGRSRRGGHVGRAE